MLDLVYTSKFFVTTENTGVNAERRRGFTL